MRFTLDLRHHQDEVLKTMVSEARIAIAKAATRHDAAYEVAPLQTLTGPALRRHLHRHGQGGGQKLGLPAREITSGAGHDAMYTARARLPDDDDLRALRRRPQPQRGGERH